MVFIGKRMVERRFQPVLRCFENVLRCFESVTSSNESDVGTLLHRKVIGNSHGNKILW